MGHIFIVILSVTCNKMYGVWKKDSQEGTSTQDETATGTAVPNSKDAATISQLQMEIVALKKQLEVVCTVRVFVLQIYACKMEFTLFQGTSVNVMETATSSL